MKEWLSRFFGEGKNKKWYDSKAIVFGAAVVAVGAALYLDPQTSIETARDVVTNPTWAGIVSILLGVKRFRAMLPPKE